MISRRRWTNPVLDVVRRVQLAISPYFSTGATGMIAPASEPEDRSPAFAGNPWVGESDVTLEEGRSLKQLHLHLLSDSTGETLDMVAKACLAQFDTVEALRHLWPMVRSEGHLDRVLDDVERRPGLVLYTVVNPMIRRELEQKCRPRGIHAVSVHDPVIDA